MAITYTTNFASLVTPGAPVTSGTLTITAGDVIVVMHCAEENQNAGTPGSTLTIVNSGTALTWNLIDTTNTNANCKITAWWALAGTTQNRTVTVSTEFAKYSTLACIVHTGAHQTAPVPAGNVFKATAVTDPSQSITPTASGSALWMCSGDWNATNSFVARTNCTLSNTHHTAGQYTTTVVRPTTQPRTDAAAFTIGETDTSTNKIAWLALEVRAASTPAYTLTADQGTFNITGQAASLVRGCLVPAAQGSFAINGQDAGVKGTYIFTVDQGSFSMNGSLALVDMQMTSATDTYALNGQAATLTRNFRLVAEQGAFSFVGQLAGFTLVSSSSAYQMPANAGSYSLAGQDCTLAASWRFAVDAGAYALAGEGAEVTFAQQNKVLNADQGYFYLDGGFVTGSHVFGVSQDSHVNIDGRCVTGLRWLVSDSGTILGYRNPVTDLDMEIPLDSDQVVEAIDSALGTTAWRNTP